MRRFFLVAASGAALALAATPASAQLFGGKRQDEAIIQLQAQVAELRTQAAASAETARASAQTQAALRAELTAAKTRGDDLEATIRSMNSTLEALTGDLATARRELASAQGENRNFVERLARLETAQNQLAAAQTQAAARPAAVAATPASAWAEARRLMDAGRFEEASQAFESYATTYSREPNVAEANYWLGETLYVRENYGDAAQAYIVALKGWPQSSWAPDALVKLSNSLIALKQTSEACKTLGEFDRRYASAPAAIKARARTARTTAKCA
jgi:tol-pal system protein YbgF